MIGLLLATMLGCAGDVDVAGELVSDLDAIARRATANHLELVVGDEAAVEKAIALVRDATTVVRFETFLLNGKHGDRLVDALIERHRAGVKIEVLIDPNGLKRNGFVGGTLNFEDKNGVLRRKLEGAGIDVRKFEKRTMNSMTFGIRGEHAKLLAVDDQVAMFGGTNFDDEENHDFNYVVRGPGVHDFVHHFRDGYGATGGTSAPVLASRGWPEANGSVRLVSTGPGDRSPKAEILGAIRNAKESVFLEMYGLTDKDVMRELRAARKRLGADKVRVMLYDNVLTPDPFAMLATDYPNATAMVTLAGGDDPVAVRLLPSPAGGKVHTKALIVDGKTALIGSANYTPQEFRAVHNYVGIVEGEEPVSALRDAFERDWSRASDKKVRRWRVLHDSQAYNP